MATKKTSQEPELKRVGNPKTVKPKPVPQSSKEDGPWVDIKAATTDDSGILKIELDWNEHFITYLRSHGYKGITEQEIVGRWVKDLHHQLLSEVVDETHSEFA